MKKIFSTVALAALAATVGLSSCGGQSTTKQNSEQTKTENKMKPIYLTKAEFLTRVFNYESDSKELKYLGDKPAIVDFYADWCGPCKAIAPVLDDLAAEYGDRIYIYKIDTDKEQELAAAFNIRSIPSLLFIPMEGEPQMAQGAMPKASFVEAIDSILLKK